MESGEFLSVKAARKRVFRKGGPLYLDYNATTPVAPEVLDAMIPYLSRHFGNPSSSHFYGTAPKKALSNARSQVSHLLSRSDASEVIFTSGGTECINWVIRSICRQCFQQQSNQRLSKVSSKRELRNQLQNATDSRDLINALLTGNSDSNNAGNNNYSGDTHHIIISSIEHPAVLETAKFVQSVFDTRVSMIDPDPITGMIEPDKLKSTICLDTVLVCIMHSNNEIGTINPINELVRLTRNVSKHILFLSDTTQSIGKIPLHSLSQLCNGTESNDDSVDFLCIGGHKVYAPKGIGALWINPRSRHRLTPLIVGASQELSLRAGTENVAYSVGLGQACALIEHELKDDKHLAHYRTLCDLFINRLMRSLPNNAHKRVILNGDPSKRLPNTLSISFALLKGDELVRRVAKNLAISAGAACHSDSVRMSHVLQSMRIDPEIGMGTVRVSVGRYTTKNEVLEAAKIMASEVTLMYRKLKKVESKLPLSSKL